MSSGSGDADVRQLQHHLHMQNQERMQGIEDSIGDLRDTWGAKAEMLVRIDENTKCVPSLLQRVDNLEKTRDNARGVMWALGIVWAAIEVLIHLFWRAPK
jgi:hypothetical protein